MRTPPYLNILTFPVSLEFRNSALGLRRRVKIGNLCGTLILPLANNNAIGESFSQLLAPKMKHLDFAERVYAHCHQHEPEGTLRWGGYFTYNQNDPVNTAIASVHSAVLSLSPSQSGRTLSMEQVAEECLQHFPQWCVSLTDWIELMTRDDLNVAHPLNTAFAPLHWTSTAWTHTSGSRPDYKYVNPPLHMFGSDGENAMDAGQWSDAIRAANAMRDLPEIWALLRDARSAQRRGNGR